LNWDRKPTILVLEGADLKMIIFPGCMVLARFQEYEMASEMILNHLGFEITQLPEFCCCGASLMPGVTDSWINLSAYTLALAEKSGANIVTLCGNCTSNFRRTNLYFSKDHKIRNQIRSALGKLDLSYGGGVNVRHLIEVLIDKQKDIRRLVQRQLTFKVAVAFPCQLLRPKEIAGSINAKDLKLMLKSLGIKIIDYPLESECCGATALLFDEEFGINKGMLKLESARSHGADVYCSSCGNCLYQMDRYQNKMYPDDPDRKMPVISLPQLVGLLFGYSEESLHLRFPEVLNFGFEQ
jgi:heterodisulfide reductase subunit B